MRKVNSVHTVKLKKKEGILALLQWGHAKTLQQIVKKTIVWQLWHSALLKIHLDGLFCSLENSLHSVTEH